MPDLTITEEDIALLESEISGLVFNEERREAIKSYGDVQACPGSGKTTLVAAKLILLAKKWEKNDQGICVLSHTNVAKNEIIERLVEHPAGFKLLSYPHFVGTIQEFVNKFIGLPFSRPEYGFSHFSEDEEVLSEIYKIGQAGFNLRGLYTSLCRKCANAEYTDVMRYLCSLYYINGDLDIGFYGAHGLISFLSENQSPTYLTLKDLKERLLKQGIYQYQDMYAFSTKLLRENPSLVEVLRMRFPCVIIDEMQDTQKFQDELINKIFQSGEVKLQRLGDPDQAIFSGMGGEPNETYNGRNDLTPIKTTHRYGQDIVDKNKGLSYKKLSNLASIRDPSTGKVNRLFARFTIW